MIHECIVLVVETVQPAGITHCSKQSDNINIMPLITECWEVQISPALLAILSSKTGSMQCLPKIHFEVSAWLGTNAYMISYYANAACPIGDAHPAHPVSVSSETPYIPIPPKWSHTFTHFISFFPE